MTMRIAALSIFALALAGQDKGLHKLEWKLAPGKAVEFGVLDRSGKPAPGAPKILVFGSELNVNSNRIAVDAYDKLPLPFLFQLPSEPFKTSMAWEHTANFFHEALDSVGGWEALVGGGSLKPVCARGRYAVKSIQKKADDEVATIDGAFTFFEIRRDIVNNQARFTVTKNDLGTLVTSVQMSVPRGMILKAGWQLKVKGQDREGGRIADRRFDLHQMMEFKEELELDAARLQPVLEAAMGRAVEWLKRQQKPGGAWTPARPGPGDAVSLTAQVVRALLAAGVKGDDPAVASAAKILRGPAPQETYALAQQVLALSLKGPTKDEADDARRLGEDLLRRRDFRSTMWSNGGRNDPPSVMITTLAIEALASARDVKVPDEIWRSALDLFTGSWIEEEQEITLDLEFEKDAVTIAADPKKVVPCSWPANPGRSLIPDPRPARKGSFFILVSALRTLMIAADRLKLDEKQRQGIDLSLRKGLAHLQQRWTLRTVPPVEGSWCAQRLEYLALLGPCLSQARLNRISASDWRLEGAALLLREQGDDGSWHAGTEQAVARTAQALLFLSAARR